MNTAVMPQVTTWSIDPAHSVAEFKVRHMMISNVKGHFSRVSGSLKLNEFDVTKSSAEASIDVASLNTREPEPDEEGELTVTGDLTFHGVTRSVVFTVENFSEPSKDPWGNTRIGLSATTRINRKDFGLGWNAALETGGVLVGDEVTINLEVEFIEG